jgi:hypothetical protein
VGALAREPSGEPTVAASDIDHHGVLKIEEFLDHVSAVSLFHN